MIFYTLSVHNLYIPVNTTPLRECLSTFHEPLSCASICLPRIKFQFPARALGIASSICHAPSERTHKSAALDWFSRCQQCSKPFLNQPNSLRRLPMLCNSVDALVFFGRATKSSLLSFSPSAPTWLQPV